MDHGSIVDLPIRIAWWFSHQFFVCTCWLKNQHSAILWDFKPPKSRLEDGDLVVLSKQMGEIPHFISTIVREKTNAQLPSGNLLQFAIENGHL